MISCKKTAEIPTPIKATKAIWFSTDSGAFKYENNKYTNFNTSNSSILSNKIYLIEIDPNGTKWFCTDKGISKFDGTTWTSYTTKDGLVDYEIHASVLDKNGKRWFSSQYAVIYFDGTKFTSVNGSSEAQGANDMFTDSKGNIWFTSYFSLTKYNGSTFTEVYYNDWSGSSDYYYNINEDTKGNMWFGHGRGAVIPTLKETTWSIFNSYNSILPNSSSSSIEALEKDKNGSMWVSIWGWGIFKYDGTNWTTLNTLNSTISSNYILEFKFDIEGNLWLLNSTRDIEKYDGKSFTSFLTGKNASNLTIE